MELIEVVGSLERFQTGEVVVKATGEKMELECVGWVERGDRPIHTLESLAKDMIALGLRSDSEADRKLASQIIAFSDNGSHDGQRSLEYTSWVYKYKLYRKPEKKPAK